jgi:hypothetical protein
MARAISLRSFQNYQAAQDRLIERCFNERRTEMAKKITVTPAVEKLHPGDYVGTVYFVEHDEAGVKLGSGFYTLADGVTEMGCRIALQAKMRAAMPNLFPPDAIVKPISKYGCRVY